MVHIRSRHQLQVVACLDGDVLALDLHIAVRRGDGNASESVHLHVAPGRADGDVALVAGARDVIDAVIVA